VELLEQQKKEGARLIKLIIDKSYVSEQDLAVSMGRVLNVSPINLARVSILPEVIELLPRDTTYNYKVVPVSRLENRLFLAMADPLNVLALDDVKRITKLEVTAAHRVRESHHGQVERLDSAKSGSMEDIIQDAQKQSEADAEADSVESVKEGVEEVNLDQTRRLQRRSAGHQTRQSHHCPSHQRPRQRHSPGAFRERHALALPC